MTSEIGRFSKSENSVKVGKSIEPEVMQNGEKVEKKKSLTSMFAESRVVGNDLRKSLSNHQAELQVKAVSWRERIVKFFSRETVLKLQEEGRTMMSILSFFGLVLIFLLDLFIRLFGRIPGIKQGLQLIGRKTGSHAWRLSEKLINRFETRPGRIRRSVLINLAFRNMRVKRTRALVTVGGMGLGIGAIVFLVSLGYGVQRLVVSRVARLDELRMADVTLQNSSNLKLDQTSVVSMRNMSGVEEVMPVVSLVGKLTFSGGQGESLVYGVTKRYLEAAGIKVQTGEYFESDGGVAKLTEMGKVAGAQTGSEYENPGIIGNSIKDGHYNLSESQPLMVKLNAWSSSPEVGYTKGVAGGIWGREVWGESYTGSKGNLGKNEQGKNVGVWLYSSYPIWEKSKGAFVPKLDDQGAQVWSRGYLQLGDSIKRVGDEQDKIEAELLLGSVLGESSENVPYSVLGDEAEATISATVVGVDSSGVEWVDMSSLEASGAATPEIMVIETPGEAKKQALVNESFLELVGIAKDKAVGESFEISFVILNTLKPDLERPAQSQKASYIISGVINEGNNPLMYVPIEDLTGLGITNFSQAKVVAEKQEVLSSVRQQIDNLGYKTTSVADTVEQIDKLFATVRLVLASFGLVALTVASLGMFNTLTVSLMERTREVGVMKAMGMRSSEVKELFLAEAMIMGLLGGVFGVLAGWAMGKTLGIILSAISLTRGVGVIDVSFIPWQFVVFVLALSFVVGVATGIYPARRARRISALNALRYE